MDIGFFFFFFDLAGNKNIEHGAHGRTRRAEAREASQSTLSIVPLISQADRKKQDKGPFSLPRWTGHAG